MKASEAGYQWVTLHSNGGRNRARHRKFFAV